MKRSEYLQNAFRLRNEGKISDEVYDAMIMNVDSFCDEDEDDRLPSSYAEIDYGDRDDAEAIDGMRFDDMNYTRYMERQVRR